MLDRTGLTGRYDFTLDYRVDVGGVPPSGETASDGAPSLVDAVRQQLGLRLAASKATIDVLAIDRVERTPTVN